jgi:hypothetical protein
MMVRSSARVDLGIQHVGIVLFAGGRGRALGGIGPVQNVGYLDVAVDQLAVTHKRLHGVIDASNDRMLYAGRPSAPVKALGGNYDSEQVRNIVLEVATNPNLGSQAARGVLDQIGDGVKSITRLKPENFDKVYEACQSLLAGKGASADAVKPHVKRTVGKVVHLNDARRARKRHNIPRKL